MIVDKNNEVGKNFYHKTVKNVIHHPNISQIHEYYDHENSYFIICDYC